MMTKLAVVTVGAPPARKRRNAALRDLDHDDQQEQRDAAGRQRFELAMAVRMVRVGRLLREPQADQRDHVRRAVGQRVEAVGEDADRAAE